MQVEIQHIFRLDEKQFGSAEVGDIVNILVPTVLYEDITKSESVIMNFRENSSLPYKSPDISPANKYAEGLSYSNIFTVDRFSRDDLFLFRYGVLVELEATQDKLDFYTIFDHYTPIGVDYPEFDCGISMQRAEELLDEAQRLSEQREADYQAAKESGEMLSGDPSNDYASHYDFLSGTRMRVTANFQRQIDTVEAPEETIDSPPSEPVTPEYEFPTEEADYVLPTEFTEDERWLHGFFEENFETAYGYVEDLRCTGGGNTEICFEGTDITCLYSNMSEYGGLPTAEEYRAALSELYSADTVEHFMENVVTATAVRKTDESESDYSSDSYNGRIYITPLDGQPYNEHGIVRLKRYIEIDGIMYKAEGDNIGTVENDGAFGYSRIVSRTEDEIIFTYPIPQRHTSEFVITAIGEGRLVKEDGRWKFGWFLGNKNLSTRYDYMWRG